MLKTHQLLFTSLLMLNGNKDIQVPVHNRGWVDLFHKFMDIDIAVIKVCCKISFN